MFTLIILTHFLHAQPVFNIFDMPNEQECWEVGMLLENELREDRFVIDVQHWCISLWSEG